MRIGVDGRELTGRPTGVGRYLAGLLRRWVDDPRLPDHRFVLYLPLHAPARRLPEPGPRLEVRRLRGRPGVTWEQGRLAAAACRDRLDCFFAPSYSGPIGVNCPLVVTVHDLSFVDHPEWFRWKEGVRRRLLTGLSVRRARMVLTDTTFSAVRLQTRLHVAPSRLRVIPLGLDAPVRRGPRLDPADPLVLFVGSIFNRRHLPQLLAAFATVADRIPTARLAIVGENRTHPYQDLAALRDRLGLGSRVTLASYVDEAELRALYGEASVFVFLSEYEGFGLTPLEALAAGVPIVVLDTSVAREVYGDAAVYVPLDAGDIAHAIQELLTGRDARERRLRHADAVLARYSWETAARETLSALTGDGAPR